MDLNPRPCSLQSYSGGSDQAGVATELCRDNLRPFARLFERELPQRLSPGFEQHVSGGYNPAADNDHLGIEQVGKCRETYAEKPAGLGKDFSRKFVTAPACFVHVF